MLCVALLALLVQNVPTPAASTGVLSGIVTRAGTLEALPKAAVELRGDDERVPPLVATTTEADGRFSFRNVQAGRYRLVISRPGFVRRAVSIAVTGGRTEDVAVAMTATGAIAGRVYGQSGEPLGNVDVAALRSSYQNGRRVLTAVQSVRTNDRGDYRLFWLAPGRYVVRATHPQAETGLLATIGQGRRGGLRVSGGGLGQSGLFEVRSTGDPILFDAFGPAGDAPPDRYVPVYFPGTTDDQAASAVELRAGADMGAIDVPVIPVRERHVRGVVINGATGQVAQYAGLSEVHADSLPDRPMGGPGGGLSNGGLPPIDPDGSFDVTLLPGRHTLMGTAGTGAGYVSVEVRDVDLDGVRIVAMPTFNVPGRIVADAPIDYTALANVRISLRRELPVPAASSSYSLPRADGTFVVAATPGDYRLNLAPFLNLAPAMPRFLVAVPKGFEHAYVKSIRLGEVDALNGGVHFEGPTTSTIEIVLGMNPGSIEGTVLTSTQAAAAGVTVAVLPNVRGRFDLVRTATTDSAGRFHLDRVAPGDYKVFAWSEVGDGEWQDPEFLRTSEERGTPIRVRDGTTEQVALMAIPPQG